MDLKISAMIGWDEENFEECSNEREPEEVFDDDGSMWIMELGLFFFQLMCFFLFWRFHGFLFWWDSVGGVDELAGKVKIVVLPH